MVTYNFFLIDKKVILCHFSIEGEKTLYTLYRIVHRVLPCMNMV